MAVSLAVSSSASIGLPDEAFASTALRAFFSPAGVRPSWVRSARASARSFSTDDQYGSFAMYSAPALLVIRATIWPPCLRHSFSARESWRSVLARVLMVGSYISL